MNPLKVINDEEKEIFEMGERKFEYPYSSCQVVCMELFDIITSK